MVSARSAEVALWDTGHPLLPAQCFPLTPRDSTSPCWSFGRGLPLRLREGQAGLALHFPVSVHSACWAFLNVWRCRWHLGSGPLRPQFTLVRIVGDQGGPPCAARGWSCGRHSWLPCQCLGRAFAKLVAEGKRQAPCPSGSVAAAAGWLLQGLLQGILHPQVQSRAGEESVDLSG